MTSNTRESLKAHNLAPHKRLGQNFLVNPHTARAIVNCGDISPEDTIVEVGVGLGAITTIIAERAARVIGIEIDSGIIRYHEEESILPENVSLLHQDILKTDLAALAAESGGRLRIMANLPYSISNPFVFKLLENKKYVDWVVVMVQREMAERLLASPGSKQYGIPSVLLQAWADVYKEFIVKPHEFHPQPKVDSMVIRIVFRKDENQALSQIDTDTQMLFQQLVRVAFAQRRKTLLNNLQSLTHLQTFGKEQAKDLVRQILESCRISPNERAENLSLTDYQHLARQANTILSEAYRA